MTKEEAETLFDTKLPMRISDQHKEQRCEFAIRGFDVKQGADYIWGFAIVPDVWFEIAYALDYTKLNKTENGLEYVFTSPE